jgi:hypothetical protein
MWGRRNVISSRSHKMGERPVRPPVSGPDPYMGSYDLTNPQSLNRYAYVLNNPLSFTDPLGLTEQKVVSPPTTPAAKARHRPLVARITPA